ncbi:MAG: PqqD family protein [Mariprofundales bacterium]|nr:PqqD family protein [Mariprofundales bacterium]
MTYHQQQPNLEIEELEGLDEVVVIHHDDNRCVSLNLTAAAVLEMCDGEHTTQDIANEFATVFNITKERALTDIEELLKQLQELNLLTP